MLKLWLVGMAVCISSLLSARQPVALKCKVEAGMRMNVENQLKLYKVEKGNMVEITAVAAAEDGDYHFSFVPEYEGFYLVGERQNYYYPVWVKGDEAISMFIGKNGGNLEGKKNSPENKLLYEWVALSQTIGNMGRTFMSGRLTYPEFFQELEKFVVQADRFKADIKTRNSYFDQLMRCYVDAQKDMFALNFLNAPRPKDYIRPEIKDFSPYYSTILSGDKFQDNTVLKLPDGFHLILLYVMFDSRMSGFVRPGNNLNIIPCSELRGELALFDLQHLRSVFQFQKKLRDYRADFTAGQKDVAEEMLRKLKEENVRQKTVDFTYPDVDGKMISLSDFKGKVVLVDVWATWCGPCRAELPALKKLEEEMEGTDLVVIGVSTDVKKDYAKWKKMVDNGDVKGIQLFADGGKALKEAYKVSGIPRFIVFGRDGEIAESSAPRPSSPDLKELLNSLLEK